MSDKKYLMEFAADPHIVKLLNLHLIDAFNAFMEEYDGTVDHVDGFMAAHNFHRIIVMDLEKNTNAPTGLWRGMAKATFGNAMDDPEGRGDPRPKE